jgi:hypothetical protein
MFHGRRPFGRKRCWWENISVTKAGLGHINFNHVNRTKMRWRNISKHPRPHEEANSRLANQKMFCLLLNSKLHHHFLKILPSATVLRQINPTHIQTSYFSKIHFNVTSCLFLRLQNNLSLHIFATKLYIISATCPIHLILLDFITVINIC